MISRSIREIAGAIDPEKTNLRAAAFITVADDRDRIF